MTLKQYYRLIGINTAGVTIPIALYVLGVMGFELALLLEVGAIGLVIINGVLTYQFNSSQKNEAEPLLGGDEEE